LNLAKTAAMKSESQAVSQNRHLIKLESFLLKYPGIVSFSITFILLCFQLFFIRPYFQNDDDVYKILLARGFGVCYTATPYFIASNIALGYFFVKWFSWFPSFPWYGWFLYAVQFLSIWSIFWILCLRNSGWFKVVLFIISCLGIQFIFFTFLQFTMTSMMAAGAGGFLFLFSTELSSRRLRNIARLFSGTLILLSWLIRPGALLAIGLAMVPLFFFKMKEGNLRVVLLKQWKFIAVMVSMMFFASLFDFVWYQKNQDWKNYQSYILQVRALHEFRSLDYSLETKPLFASVGWSENDLLLFGNGYWMDQQKYSLNKIKTLKDQFPMMGSEGKPASVHSLQELFSYFWDQRFLLYFFLFWIFCGRRYFWFLLVQLTWIIYIFLFLLYFMKLIDEITVPMLAYLANVAVFYAEPPFFMKRKKSLKEYLLPGIGSLLLCLIFIFAFPNLRNFYVENLEWKKTEIELRDCLKQINPAQNQLYIMWAFPFTHFSAFDTFDCLRPFHMIPLCSIEGSPATTETLKKFKIENVFKEAVDNPNIFIIYNKLQGMHYYRYLQENAHQITYVKKVYDFPDFQVFTIHLAKDLFEKKQIN